MTQLDNRYDNVVAKATNGALLATALLAMVGCGYTEDTPEIGSAQAEAQYHNGIWQNGIWQNGIWQNGVSGTLQNLSFDPSADNGIVVGGGQALHDGPVSDLVLNGNGSSGVTLGGGAFDAQSQADFDKLFTYIVECALPENTGVSVELIDGTSKYFDGGLGLGSEWANSALSAAGQSYVSACLAARVNAEGWTVQLSLRGGSIGTTAVERSAYRWREGAFWGTFFGTNPEVHSCVAQGGGIAGRDCAEGACGFTDMGSCDAVCESTSAADGHYENCGGETAVVTVFLPYTESVALGDEHGCVNDDAGQVWCWGENGQGQLGDGTNTDRAAAVSHDFGAAAAVEAGAGAAHSCVRLDDGSVQCTGDNQYGQLGNGSLATSANQWQDVSDLDSAAASLTVGKNHACVLQSDGSVECWGDNLLGQLGDGSRTPASTPVQTAVFERDAVAVATGHDSDHTCAVKSDGSLYCWGWNAAGQLGDGTSVDRSAPVHVAQDVNGNSFDDITDACTGQLHTCARDASGDVSCFGSNDLGRLGNPNIAPGAVPHPVAVDLPGAVVQGGLSCGEAHTCALLDSGAVYCWGANAAGQLGNGSYNAAGSDEPVLVSGLSGTVTQVSAAGSQTCAQLDDDSLHCWGQLYSGQTSASPTAFAGLNL